MEYLLGIALGCIVVFVWCVYDWVIRVSKWDELDDLLRRFTWLDGATKAHIKKRMQQLQKMGAR